jgi:CheY-like chemotaxis protein
MDIGGLACAIIESMQNRALISVVDDDVSSRESLPDLLRMLGFAAVPFASAEDFLVSDALDSVSDIGRFDAGHVGA